MECFTRSCYIKALKNFFLQHVNYSKPAFFVSNYLGGVPALFYISVKYAIFYTNHDLFKKDPSY
jgi:hypothetical protein